MSTCYERLPTPWGLLRGGVAPDHHEIKRLDETFDRQVLGHRCRFLGNVEVGTDVAHADLMRHYDAVIYAVGAQTDKSLGIPGEDLPGSLPATDFVGLVQRPSRPRRAGPAAVGPPRGDHRKRQRGRRRCAHAHARSANWSAPTPPTTRSRPCATAASRRSWCWPARSRPGRLHQRRAARDRPPGRRRPDRGPGRRGAGPGLRGVAGGRRHLHRAQERRPPARVRGARARRARRAGSSCAS